MLSVCVLCDADLGASPCCQSKAQSTELPIAPVQSQDVPVPPALTQPHSSLLVTLYSIPNAQLKMDRVEQAGEHEWLYPGEKKKMFGDG